MRVARVVLLTQERAVLRLRPSWFARLFGACDLVAELEYVDSSWVSKYTRERLGWIKYSAIIKAAMEGYPLEDASIPAARLLKE